ncbi:MAG TPA: ribosome small subunit-dependent GTPase A [Steroidobacteraceae bacterium]|nr:ribosome small subunit-dependent GTPase A [Steroidobacteraceae bacterium]
MTNPSLSAIGFNALVAQALAQAQAPQGAALARVIEQHGTHCVVHTGAATHIARPHPALARECVLAVGDWVFVEVNPADAWIVSRLTPYTSLQRIDPSGARQTLVNNVDVAFLVMGLDRDFNPRRLERYLALVKSAGVWPVVVLTKADLCSDVDARLEELARRLPAAIDRHALDATDAQAVQALAPYLGAGQTGVLLGSSGAGKSTLTNALAGMSVERTAEVRASDSRGRHTTTSRHLHALPGGACLIDTPGLRGLRLDLDEDALAPLFEDIAQLAQACRYRDCSHENEPGCAVRAGVPADRLENYLKLRREVARDRADPRAQRAAKARGKILERAYRALQKQRGR